MWPRCCGRKKKDGQLCVLQKKEFRSAIKENDQTKIWRLTAINIGRKPERLEVMHLVEQLATTKRDYKNAYRFAFCDNEWRRGLLSTMLFQKRRGFRMYDDSHYRSEALQMLRRLLTEEISNYTKVPMMGHTHLYFCSPSYGHADYNKVRTCKIEGNEEFVKKVIDLSNRIYKKKTFDQGI